MQSEKLRPYFLLILLVGALWLTAVIFAPFLKPLALAAVFAVVLQGLYGKLTGLFRNRPSLAAFATVLVSVILILLPLSLLAVVVGNEARDVYLSLESGGGRDLISGLAERADEAVSAIIPGLGGFSNSITADLDTYARGILQWVVEHSGAIFSSISALLLSLFIFLIALYYLLRDGKRVRQVLIELSPLSDTEDEKVFVRLERGVNSVIKGNLVIALIQGLLSILGFTIFGVPNAILWGTVTAVAALIPGIGTALVFLPAILFLFFSGSALPALGLLIWGAFAVGLIDNLLGPKLVGSGMQIHPLLVLLSVLGGVAYFGPTGIFLGPLSLTLFFALLSIYADSSKQKI